MLWIVQTDTLLLMEVSLCKMKGHIFYHQPRGLTLELVRELGKEKAEIKKQSLKKQIAIYTR